MGSGSDNRASKPEAVAMGVELVVWVVVEKSDDDCCWVGILATATEVMVVKKRERVGWVDDRLSLRYVLIDSHSIGAVGFTEKHLYYNVTK